MSTKSLAELPKIVHTEILSKRNEWIKSQLSPLSLLPREFQTRPKVTETLDEETLTADIEILEKIKKWLLDNPPPDLSDKSSSKNNQGASSHQQSKELKVHEGEELIVHQAVQGEKKLIDEYLGTASDHRILTKDDFGKYKLTISGGRKRQRTRRRKGRRSKKGVARKAKKRTHRRRRRGRKSKKH